MTFHVTGWLETSKFSHRTESLFFSTCLFSLPPLPCTVVRKKQQPNLSKKPNPEVKQNKLCANTHITKMGRKVDVSKIIKKNYRWTSRKRSNNVNLMTLESAQTEKWSARAQWTRKRKRATHQNVSAIYRDYLLQTSFWYVKRRWVNWRFQSMSFRVYFSSISHSCDLDISIKGLIDVVENWSSRLSLFAHIASQQHFSCFRCYEIWS